MKTKVAEFRVRNVGLAARCEVCHQDDLFDPATGRCERCESIVAAIRKPCGAIPHEIATTTPVSNAGRRLSIAATIFALCMAIPGVFGLLGVGYWGFLITAGITRLESDTLLILFGVNMGLYLPALGFILNFWYLRIAARDTETGARKTIWVISTIYNAILLAGGIVLSMSADFTEEPIFFIFSEKPIFFMWLVGISLMILISAGACIEEFRRRHSTGPGE